MNLFRESASKPKNDQPAHDSMFWVETEMDQEGLLDETSYETLTSALRSHFEQKFVVTQNFKKTIVFVFVEVILKWKKNNPRPRALVH